MWNIYFLRQDSFACLKLCYELTRKPYVTQLQVSRNVKAESTKTNKAVPEILWRKHQKPLKCNVIMKMPCHRHNHISQPARDIDISSIGCASAWYADGRGFDPHVRQHSFVAIGHKIISTAMLSLQLIQEGQLSVTGERMCTKYW